MAASSVDLPASFERHLRAENKSARTVQTYLEAFLTGLLARWKPAAAADRYRARRVFYAWLEEEGEIATDPMAKMKPPRVPEQPAPVLTEDLLRRLLASCAGRGFEAHRDRALILPLLDTGGRLTEIAGMWLGDLNSGDDVVIVVGKGGRECALPFGNKTGKALDQYLRAATAHQPGVVLDRLQGSGDRLRHRAAAAPPGPRGRDREPARPPVRHTFAHLRQGGGETDLMRLAG